MENRKSDGMLDFSIGYGDPISQAAPFEESSFWPLLSHPSTIIFQKRFSPIWILLILILSIFISEVIAMTTVNFVDASLTFAQEVFIDALIMTILVFPVVYFFAFRSLLSHISERQRAQLALQKANEELALRVRERMEELSTTKGTLKQRQSAFEGVLKGTHAVWEHREFSEIANIILDYCKQLTGATASYLALTEDDEHTVVILDSGVITSKMNPSLATLKIGLQDEAFAWGKTVYHNDCSQSEWGDILPAEHIRLHNILLSPLNIDHNAAGAIGLVNKPGGFTENDVQMATAFGEIAAIGFRNKKVEQDLLHARNELENRVKQRTEELARANEELQAGRQRMKTLSRRLVDVQESERRVIAHELHDEAGQILASLMMNLKRIEQSTAQPQVILAETAEIEAILINLQENLHRLAMSLRPASLDHLGLVTAVRQNAEVTAEKHGLKMQFKANIDDDQLSADAQIGLYRIIQETLTNVVRHAKATDVDILLHRRNDTLIAVIEDNGCGFDPGLTSKRESLGLLGMRERAEMLGGKLNIESAPGKGTTIQVEVPYANSNSGHR